MKISFLAPVLIVLVSSCSSSPYRASDSLRPEDRSAFRAIAKEHIECLGSETSNFIRGSDDVAFLTKHISSMCEPILVNMDKEIQGRGYSPAYAKGYVGASRQAGEQITASFILKHKTVAP